MVSATSGRLGIDGREALFVLSVFSLSRLLVFGAMVLSPLVVPPVQRSGAWNLDDPILRPRFDAGWYLTIAKDGYSYDGDPGRQQNIVFLSALSPHMQTLPRDHRGFCSSVWGSPV